MEDLNKHPYSRCMYGNYKMDTLEAKSGSEGLKSGSKWIFAAAAIIMLGIIIGFIGCKPQQTVIKEETVTRYIDSTIWHTDTTYYQVPIEVYSDFTSLLDTLRLQTNYSIAWSAVDTNNMMLVGEIRNKDIKVPIKYLWKEKVITKDTTIFKEHIEYVPKDVIVEKKVTPQWAWFTLVWALITVASIAWSVYKRFRKI